MIRPFVSVVLLVAATALGEGLERTEAVGLPAGVPGLPAWDCTIDMSLPDPAGLVETGLVVSASVPAFAAMAAADAAAVTAGAPALSGLERGTGAVSNVPAFGPLGAGLAEEVDPGGAQRFEALNPAGVVVAGDVQSFRGLAHAAQEHTDRLMTPFPVWSGGPLGELRSRAYAATEQGKAGESDATGQEFWKQLEAGTARRAAFAEREAAAVRRAPTEAGDGQR